MYTIEKAWVDAAGRTRTWNLLQSGVKLCEICCKRDAQRLADALNSAHTARASADK